jgi:hypothetical protein
MLEPLMASLKALENPSEAELAETAVARQDSFKVPKVGSADYHGLRCFRRLQRRWFSEAMEVWSVLLASDIGSIAYRGLRYERPPDV